MVAARQSVSNKNSGLPVPGGSVGPGARLQQVYLIPEKDVQRKAGSSDEPALTLSKSKGALLNGAGSHAYPGLAAQTRNSLKQDVSSGAPQSQTQANMSGLLNMSAQRACLETKEGTSIVSTEAHQPASPSAHTHAAHAAHSSHFVTHSDGRLDESLQV